MKRYTFIAILLGAALLLVASCSTPATPAANPTETPDISTPSVETPCPSPPPDLSRLTTKCVNMIIDGSDSYQLDGILFVIELGEDESTHLSDLHSGQKLDVDIGTSHIVVSPDRSRMAAIDRRQDKLIILDSSGNLLEEIPNWGYEFDLIQWLEGDQLVFKAPYGETTNESDSIIILNLSSTETQEITPDFPHFTEYVQDITWDIYSACPLVVNPQLTHLIYPSVEGADYSLILWDLQANQEAGRVHHHGYNGAGVNTSAPVWTHDGMSFITSAMLRYVFDPGNSSNPLQPLRFVEPGRDNAYINIDDELPYTFGFELIRVYQNGEMQRLSYLTTTYTAFQDDWALSPDETRIAFWLSIEDDDNPIDHELAVLNVESGEVTNYCITGNRTPIWSPDGRQIAIPQYNQGVLDFMIVDIEEGIAYDITEQENVRIEGWLVSNP